MKKARIVEDRSLRNRVFVFRDRDDAGNKLADILLEYRNRDPIILAIPSGGVPVGVAIALRLEAPFDLIVSRKMPLPHTREAGFGAVTWENIVVYNEPLITSMRLDQYQVNKGLLLARQELLDKTRLFRGSRPTPKVNGRSVILVDDGLASGFTMIAAAVFVNKHGAKEIVVAVPTAPMHSVDRVSAYVDEIVCPNIREGFSFAVADAYVEWHDLSEKEVESYLKKISKWIS